jgi:hypothetical protein
MIDRVALVTPTNNALINNNNNNSPNPASVPSWARTGSISNNTNNSHSQSIVVGGLLSPASSSVLTSMESMDSLEGFESAESGFMGSRPSMADFIPNGGGIVGGVGGYSCGGDVVGVALTPGGTPTGSSLYCGNQPGSGGNAGGVQQQQGAPGTGGGGGGGNQQTASKDNL